MATLPRWFRRLLVLVLLLSAAPGLAQAAPPAGAKALPALRPDQGPAPRLRLPDAGRLQELREQR